MKPNYLATDILQPSMESILLSMIDGSHPGTSASIIALIVGWYGFLPEASSFRETVLTEGNVDEKFLVAEIGLEVGRGLGGRPLAYRSYADCKIILASQLAGAFEFVIP